MTSEQRAGWYAIANIWFGGVVGLPALLLAGRLVESLSLGDIFLAGLLGYGFVVAYMSLLSVKAVDYRSDTVELARRPFGENGANILVGLIVGISTLGWFGALTGIVGRFFVATADTLGWTVSLPFSSFLWGLVMTFASVLGFRYLKWLNLIAAPAILLLIAYSVYASWTGDAFTRILRPAPIDGDVPFLHSVGMVIGLFSVGGLIAPDYNRFAVSKKDAVWGSFIGLLPMGTALLIVGAILAILQHTGDITQVWIKLGWPLWGMVTLLLVTWTSNAMCLYSGGIGFTKAFHLSSRRRPLLTFLCGVAGSALAAMDVLSAFTTMLLLLTATVPPIAGVIISHYYGRATQERLLSLRPPVNGRGLLAWVIGVAFTMGIQSDIRHIVGIVVAGVAYTLIVRMTTRRKRA